MHLILDFQSISNVCQDVGHTIRAGDPRICRIDVSIPGFLTCEDIVLVEIPLVLILPPAMVLIKETASSRLSLEEEIDKFYLEEEEDQGDQVIPISDAKKETDRLSGVHTPILVISHPDSSSKEEEEEMALNQTKGLRDLMVVRNKGSTSKEVPKSSISPNLPPPPTNDLGLLPIPNLKKKRKD